jgi:hypothetical protein
MRIVALMLALAFVASPALADEPASSSVVVLRGSGAPPTPSFEPPAQPEVQTVDMPVYYYPVWFNGRAVSRRHHAHPAVHSSARGR